MKLFVTSVVVWSLLLMGMGASGCDTRLKQEGEAEPSKKDGVRPPLDLASFQKEVAGIEKILKQSQAKLDDGAKIAEQAMAMAKKVQREVPERVRRQDAMMILLTFGEYCSQQEDVGYGTVDLESAKKQWAETKRLVFGLPPSR